MRGSFPCESCGYYSRFPGKNVGDSHKVTPEKCGKLAHNTQGKMWERRGGAHSGAFPDFRSDALLMPSLVPFWCSFSPRACCQSRTKLPDSVVCRLLRPEQYPPASLFAPFASRCRISLMKVRKDHSLVRARRLFPKLARNCT